MQVLLNHSKYLLVLALLSLSFSLALYTADNPVLKLSSVNEQSAVNDRVVATIAEPASAIAAKTPLVTQQVAAPTRVIKTSLPIARSKVTVWNSMRTQFQLDHRENTPAVQHEIKKILADKKKFNHILLAAQPYIYFIYSQTQAKGLPAEIALLPIIESEFNPNDHSTKGATGLWQLMPGTAKGLGIKNVRGYNDGRRNVVASTNAALVLLKDLSKLFKSDWYLALAAYNAGEAKVMSAERRANSHSYWNLKLPLETRVYVPKILAVAAILKNPSKYGVTIPAIYNQPYFATLQVNKQVNLASIAKKSGVATEQLVKLNPDYRNGILALGGRGPHTLLVPIEKANQIKNQLSANIVI